MLETRCVRLWRRAQYSDDALQENDLIDCGACM